MVTIYLQLNMRRYDNNVLFLSSPFFSFICCSLVMTKISIFSFEQKFGVLKISMLHMNIL